jgi:hypothetical protein
MNPLNIIENQWVKQPSTFDARDALLQNELDRKELIEIVCKLTKLHADGTIDEESFKGVLQLTIGQFIEEEVNRRLSNSIEHTLNRNKLLNVFLGSS